MKVLFLVGVLGLAGPALGKERAAKPEGSTKEPARSQDKGDVIKDDEAVRCIVERLTGDPKGKGWKVELKDVVGSAREFVATNGGREEKGTVNVARSYPNQGALRVYVVPRD